MALDPTFRRAREGVRRRVKVAAPHVLTRLPGSSANFGPPRKLVPSVAEWTHRWNAGCDPTDAAALVWVHEAEPMKWSPSIGINDVDLSSPEPHSDVAGPLTTGARHEGRPTFVSTMPRGRVAGYFGSVITPDDGLLAEASFGFVDDDRRHPIRRQRSLGTLEHLEGTAATVAFGHADAYYHWLFDVLPRLEILRLAGWDHTTWEHLVVNFAGADYARETLHRFGVPDEHIRVLDDGSQVVADRLVVPSPVGVSGQVPVWACELLRNRLAPPGPAVGPPLRLYVSRSDAAQRRVAGEERLVARLEGLGFTCLTLSGRPLDEQIELFRRAEIVVGPHGGGLSNLVWCSPGTAVVELYGCDYVNPVFWRLSDTLGLRHHHVIGVPATPGMRRGYGAMVVDFDVVLRLTEHALGGSTSPREIARGRCCSPCDQPSVQVRPRSAASAVYSASWLRL
jgi:hypothetical protein